MTKRPKPSAYDKTTSLANSRNDNNEQKKNHERSAVPFPVSLSHPPIPNSRQPFFFPRRPFPFPRFPLLLLLTAAINS